LVCRIKGERQIFSASVHDGVIVRRRARHVDSPILRTSNAIARPREISSPDLITAEQAARRFLAANACSRVVCGHNAALRANLSASCARPQSARAGGGLAPEAKEHYASVRRWFKRRAETNEAIRADDDGEAAAGVGRQCWSAGNAS